MLHSTNIVPFVRNTGLPDGDAVFFPQPHGVFFRDVEGVVEGIQVSHHLVAADLGGGVWVDRDPAWGIGGRRFVLNSQK